MIAPFRNHLPVKIRFGDGVASELAGVLADEGASRPFVIIDRGLPELVPGVAAALEPLTGAVRFEKDAGEPTVALVEEAAAALHDSGADAVVAHRRGLCDGHRQGRPPGRRPGRAVPPVRPRRGRLRGAADPAGVHPDDRRHRFGGVRRSGHHRPETHVKAGIASPLLRAQYALVDPVLTHGLPRSITAYTGIDALAQAIAALVVTVRTPIGDAVGLEATRLAGQALVRVCRDGSDADARSRMACASLLAGLAMNISDCGSEHSLAQALGGMLGLPHGLTIGLVLAETMDRDRRYVPEQFERVADALGEPEDGSGDGSRAVRAVHRILTELQFETMESVGVKEEMLEELADKALADYFISVAPAPWSADEVRDAYRAGLALGATR